MTHEFDGKKYEKASTHQKEWGTKIIAELVLQGTEHVLDLGCGDGALTVQIAALVLRNVSMEMRHRVVEISVAMRPPAGWLWHRAVG